MQISVRTEPGGKCVAFVDGDNIRAEPGGPALLFIDGPNIRTGPGGRRLFFIDSDMLQHEPGGPTLACIDGRHILRAPGGRELLYIDGKEIKPSRHGERLYFVDGDVLDRPQLMAVLHVLRPELLDPTKDPGYVANEFAGGTYSIANFQSSDGVKRAGKIVIRKQGEVYAMDLQFDAGDPWQGVAIVKKDELWAAMGPVNTVGLAIYKIDGGKLFGTWMNATGDAKTFGTEDPASPGTPGQFGGPYTITGAKAPFTGAAYAATLSLDHVPGAYLVGDARVFLLEWDFGGGYKIKGVGFKGVSNLAAATSSGADFAIARFKIDPVTGGLTGDFYTKLEATGSFTLTRDNA